MSSEIREGIPEAFTAQYGHLQQVAFEEWPELSIFGAEQILNALAENLHKYRRPAGPRFMNWASAWVRRETRRHRFLTELFRDHYALVFAAVNRGLFLAPIDYADELKDHEFALYVHLLQNPRKIDALMKPKKAKMTSMLYALAASRTRGYRSRVSDRYGKVNRLLDAGDSFGDCEWGLYSGRGWRSHEDRKNKIGRI